MKAKRLVCGLLTSMMALLFLALTLAKPVAAARPEIVTRNVDLKGLHSGLTATCGFPIYRDIQGIVRTITHVDEEGNPTMVIDHAVFRGTLSANGKSLNVTVAGPTKILMNDDGTQTVILLGVVQRHAPGAGIVAGQAGRVVMTVDANGEVLSVDFQAGLDESLTEICEVLGPDVE